MSLSNMIGGTVLNSVDTTTRGDASVGMVGEGADASTAPTRLEHPEPQGVWHRLLQRYAFGGLIGALVFWWLSFTPSLLPRGPLFQGLVSGASAALGYCICVFFTWLARYLVSRDEPWPCPPRWAWLTWAVLGVVGTTFMFYWFMHWQNDIRDLMGVDRLAWTAYPKVAVVALVVFVLLMSIGQLWGAGVKWLSRWFTRYVPPRISAAAAAVIIVVITAFVLNGVVANYGMSALNASFAAANDETKPDSVPPTSELRSGGPGSLVSWDSLGREGRVIVSKGPTQADLEAFNGAPALPPIRVFAGLESSDSIKENAELVARELERTGGLQRAVVAVGSTTGSGWLNKATIDSLEYMYNGDTAIASMQYSYLPSWLSFLVDKERARQAGLALFEAVSERVRAIPEAQRPKLVVFGESLGSFGGEAAFGTIPDIAARTNGALFSGPTFNNTLWRDTTSDRDPGSPHVLPIYNDGTQVRFIADEDDLTHPESEWKSDRIVYLQHSSDPITWWSPRLILNRPDWLEEPHGSDVLEAVRWIPFVTFLQVSADMAVSTNVPDRHGHNYLSALPYSWEAILQPPGWTDAKTAALLPRLSRDG